MSTLTPLPFDSVPEWFEHQVRATPDAVALIFDERPVTYADLNGRANRLARVLQSLGVGPDKVVAICLSRTPELIVTLLAIMKAGGGYLPIDRDLPQERQALMLRDAQPTVLVTESAFLHTLPATDVPLFILDAEEARIAKESEANLLLRATADHLAYILYTSGSTGVPKGVEIQHRAFVNLLASVPRVARSEGKRRLHRHHHDILRHRGRGNLPPTCHRREAHPAQPRRRRRRLPHHPPSRKAKGDRAPGHAADVAHVARCKMGRHSRPENDLHR